MAELQKRGGAQATAEEEEEEEERLLMEEVTMLDFDMLCSTVALQAHNGNWGKLNGENDEDNLGFNYGGGVHRMWEGELVYDCFDDPRIASQSTCCPWYRFGKNMKRAGLGSSFLQGSVYLILVIVAACSLLAFTATRRYYFLYLAVSFAISLGMYLGYYRVQIKKKFNIKGGDSSLDDCAYHLICPCCSLCQESRTLEMNNVQDGIWHGPGDTTICIGSFSDDSTPFVVSTQSPEFLNMQKTSNDSVLLTSTSVIEHSSSSIPPSE